MTEPNTDAILDNLSELMNTPIDNLPETIVKVFDAGYRLACGQSCGCMDGETPTDDDRREALDGVTT